MGSINFEISSTLPLFSNYICIILQSYKYKGVHCIIVYDSNMGKTRKTQVLH